MTHVSLVGPGRGELTASMTSTSLSHTVDSMTPA